MVQSITKGIKISIQTRYEGTYIKNGLRQFAFAYTITIENQSKDVVQLIARHWEIKDALNEVDLVYGEGVVGKKPVINPGNSYTYSSGCLLHAPFGSMNGYYEMVNFSTTKTFRAIIPVFKLSTPFSMN
ncbi:Co2+/Mg2+ efflux protein ApaG [Patiriisocius marinus]|uniref:Co2+/Mg2+ efflux protein ApaG n=1 Tax=Patiriisocius marinus TaxID=1397112 RepID=A0A5J4J1X6_9FLAO|nr:Co2+/Mg2+ efflux protein ApaG [Patiriisocius marinus]GER59843.1 Co2+/Mg2+ efflux protein ApaG [Patiriisocius marinus]